MIDKGEIDQASGDLGVTTANVQRDYVFGWLLAGLFRPENPLAGRLILKGGNALRKGYFAHGRFSNDLDFSTLADLSDEQIHAGLVNALEYAAPQSGVDFSIRDPRVNTRSMADSDARVHEARVYFRSFYGEEDVTIKVDLDVVEFDRILLPVQSRHLIHNYSDRELCKATLSCWKLEELLAAKLKALMHRSHSPDLYDLVHALFVQQVLRIDRLEVVRTLLRRTIYEGHPRALLDQLLQIPLEAFRGLWQKFLVLPRQAQIAFDDAERYFRELIPALFALLAPQAAPAYAGLGLSHLSTNHRATILEAGRLQRLLRIVYDGMSRRVEPYALAYKRRKDGVAREYFYARDLSGGRSGEIGIKSFIADKLQSVEPTQESFTPLYPIELTKAGTGFFSSPTFTTPGSYGWRPTSPSRPRTRSEAPANYTIECTFCGKRFKRTKLDTRLNKHTDGYGNQCYGRIGVLV